MDRPHPGLIVGLALPKHGDDDDMIDDKYDEMDEHKEAMKDAASEMFKAIKHNDEETFSKSLMAYCDLHKHAPDDEPSEDDISEHMGDEDDDDNELEL